MQYIQCKSGIHVCRTGVPVVSMRMAARTRMMGSMDMAVETQMTLLMALVASHPKLQMKMASEKHKNNL